MANQTLPEGVRRVGLATVGGVLYLALSKDTLDGLSDEEFKLLKDNGPAFFQLLSLLDRTGAIPEGYRLPPGFAEHFTNDVLPDIEKVRDNPSARRQVRSEISDTLKSNRKLDELYTRGGDTYSDMLRRSVHDTSEPIIDTNDLLKVLPEVVK